MKKWMKALPVFGAAILIASGFGLTNTPAGETGDSTIIDRVYIGEISVGGLTEQEASQAVEDYIEELCSESFTLDADGKTISVTGEELGLTWENTEAVEQANRLGKSGNLIARYKIEKDLENEDRVFPITLSVDESKATAFLEEHLEEINQEAVDFGLTRENGAFVITGGEDGVTLDVAESVSMIVAYFEGDWESDGTISLAASVEEPQGSEEELAAVQDVLGTFTTNYSSSAAGRKQNIKNGCSFINGTLLYPGDTFSVYETVSPFNAENGYALAGMYENGSTVDAYGGGICQVSSTLYNAVIRSEMEIVERSGHSMLVNYVDPSADAAIAGASKDFKFKNTLDTPVYIEGSCNGSTITFTVYGKETRPSNRSISFVSETLSTTEPTTKYEASGDAIGVMTKTQSSHTGKTARLWKIVTVDGVEESREVFNETSYTMSPNIYSVGTASSDPEATKAMKAAIATQNESTIRAAMSEWNDSALEKKQAEKEAEEAAAAADAAADKAATDTTTTDKTATADTKTADTKTAAQ